MEVKIQNSKKRDFHGKIYSKSLALIRTIQEKIIKKYELRSLTKPLLIKTFINKIELIANNYGSHNYLKDGGIPTKFTVLSLKNALIDILLWFKKEMENIK